MPKYGGERTYQSLFFCVCALLHIPPRPLTEICRQEQHHPHGPGPHRWFLLTPLRLPSPFNFLSEKCKSFLVFSVGQAHLLLKILYTMAGFISVPYMASSSQSSHPFVNLLRILEKPLSNKISSRCHTHFYNQKLSVYF